MREYVSIRLKESVNIGAKEAVFFKLDDAYGTVQISRDDDGFFTIRVKPALDTFVVEVPQGNVRQAEPMSKQPRVYKPAASKLLDP